MSKEKVIKKNMMLLVGVATPLVVATARRGAQDQVPDLNAESGTTTPANSAAPAREPETEHWNLFYQATSIANITAHSGLPTQVYAAFRTTRSPTFPLAPRFFSAFGWGRIRNSISIPKSQVAAGSAA